MREQVLLFDMDGTVNNSGEGITKCVAHALAQFGITADPATLECFIGPPLTWSFPHYFGLTAEQAERGVALFQERYNQVGKFENKVYDGVREALAALRAAGFRLGIATSKPESFAKEIVDHFQLTEYFTCVSGASMEEHETKADVIRAALSRMGGVAPQDALMIGDREYDIDGAHTVGLRAVGVLWGYGTREEMVAHHAEYIVETPDALVRLMTE